MGRKSNKQKIAEESGWPIISRDKLEHSFDNFGMYEYEPTSGRMYGYQMYWSSRRGGVWVKD
jgi:hypothetical protein